MSGRYDGAVVPRRGRFHLPLPPATRVSVLLAVPLLLLAAVVVQREHAAVTVVHRYGFEAAADAYVSSALPTTNLGGLTVLRINSSRKKVQRGYLRFDLHGLAGPVIGATLWFYPLSSSSSGLAVAEVGSAGWDERTISFRRDPPIGTVLASSGPLTARRWVSLDVTAAVRGDGPVTLALLSLHPPAVLLASRETAFGPQLEVHTRLHAVRQPTDPPAPTLPEPGAGITRAAGDPVVVAAGEIACDPADTAPEPTSTGPAAACQAGVTADLALALRPSAVLALGDLQFDDAQRWKFDASYDLTWGRLLRATRPVPGHQEYLDGGRGRLARAYFDYFGRLAGDPSRGWYSFDLGGWHLVALNGNCRWIGGCQTGSAQERWLRADLAAHRSLCTLAYWNAPRFSSSALHRGQTVFDAFWRDLYAAGADVVLAAGAEDYERFAPQDPDARTDPRRGVREFVVGTGGHGLGGFGRIRPSSQARVADRFGVLALTLHPHGYDWRFVPAGGLPPQDSGSATCH